MVKGRFRTVKVTSLCSLTPHMKRIILAGENLSDFPLNYESGYIKLLFSPEGSALKNIEDTESFPPIKPMMRTYTIRAFNPEKKEMAVDFALHPESEGPASRWATQAKVGDEIIIAGPGPAKLVNNNADWFLFVGDMTSLPAISCNLEQLPDNAKGYAVIEVTTEKDIQVISSPSGIEIKWLVKNKNTSPQLFIDTIKKLNWLNDSPYVWCACEFSIMRMLRKYFKNERNIEKESMYISSYWKSGHSEDQHKIIKQQDMASA